MIDRVKEASQDGGEKLDKVRDLLFGSQARENDKRFARLEERLLKETATLRKETQNRFNSMEKYIKSELESIVDRLKMEQKERVSTVKDIGDVMRGTDKRLRDLDERSSKEQQKLRGQILEQSKNLRDELQRSHEEQLGHFESACDELRSEKADRSVMANLLTDMALKLNNDVKRKKR